MTETPNASLPAVEQFARLWADSTASVLAQLHGSAFTTAIPESTATESAATPSVWVRCNATGVLQGAATFELDLSSAVRFAQLLMAEPLNATAPLTDGYKDAIAEVFRQFAGLAATAAKSCYGSAVEFQIGLIASPEAAAAASFSRLFNAPTLDPLGWRLLLSPELAASIDAAATKLKTAAAESVPSSPATSPAATVTSSASASAPENLGLLLDVTLDAHLRFGQRQMLLREILDLRAGSVVELDRRLQEPAELLVSGRVVARGEVVIVDGSYGIRITDIVQPQQRLTSLKA